jgi:hypothetical protein
MANQGYSSVEHVTIRSSNSFDVVRAKLAGLVPRIDDGIFTLVRATVQNRLYDNAASNLSHRKSRRRNATAVTANPIWIRISGDQKSNGMMMCRIWLNPAEDRSRRPEIGEGSAL